MDVKRSDLNLLISLDILLDELNVTRAAKRLNVSQSALSGQLARLRDMFGDPLLVPAEHGRGMVPTPRGLALRPRLAEALVQLRGALAADLFDPSTSSHTFVVATNDSLFTILCLGVLARVVAIGNPALRISFVPGREEDLLARMERSEVDLALGIAGKMHEGLKARVLLRDTFCVGQRKGHPRGTGEFTLDDYCATHHVMVSQFGHAQGPIDALLEQHERARTVAVTVPSYNQVSLVLARTDCLATLPSRLLGRYDDELDLFDPPFDIPAVDLAMAWHPRLQTDHAHQWLRGLFVEESRRAEADSTM